MAEVSEIGFGRVAELFEQTVELPPEERDAFLDRACGDDPSVPRR